MHRTWSLIVTFLALLAPQLVAAQGALERGTLTGTVRTHQAPYCPASPSKPQARHSLKKSARPSLTARACIGS